MSSSPEVISRNVSYEEIVDDIRRRGQHCYGERGFERIIFTNGCFDILHPGHLSLLWQCRQLAGPKGAVVVGVNTDSSVKRLKGETRPINSEDHRLLLLSHLKCVDFAVSFDENTPLELIEALRPNIIVKGEDYRNKEVVGSNLATVVFVPLVPNYSTTSIIERLRDVE